MVKIKPRAHGIFMISQARISKPTQPDRRNTQAIVRISEMIPKPAETEMMNLPSRTWLVVSRSPPRMTANPPEYAITHKMRSRKSMSRYSGARAAIE